MCPNQKKPDSCPEMSIGPVRVIISLIMTVAVLQVFAQAQADFKFEPLIIDHNHYNYTTLVVYQDSRGYMWFGGLTGLKRFDGHDLVSYSFEANNPRSLSDHKINHIFENIRIISVQTKIRSIIKMEMLCWKHFMIATFITILRKNIMMIRRFCG